MLDGTTPFYLLSNTLTMHCIHYEAEYVVVLEREKSMFVWIKGKMELRRDKAGRPSMEFVYDEGKVVQYHKCTKRPSSAEHPYSCTYC